MKLVKIERLKVGSRFRLYPGNTSPILIRGRAFPGRRISALYPGYFLSDPRYYLTLYKGAFVYIVD